jgi:hypothetical protein
MGADALDSKSLESALKQYNPRYVGFSDDEKLLAMRAVAGINLSKNMERRMAVPRPDGRLLIRVVSTPDALLIELVSRNPARVPTDAQVEDTNEQRTQMKASLVEKYGVGQFEESGAAWTVPDLQHLAHALSLVPSDDRRALGGLHFVRVAALASGQSEKDTRTEGRFVVEGSKRSIQLPSSAFQTDGQLFDLPTPQGAVPAGQRTILHEIGHALAHHTDDAPVQAALTAHNELVGKHNDLQKAEHKLVDRHNAYVKEEKAISAALTKLVDDYEGQKKNASADSNPKVDSINAHTDAVGLAIKLFNALKKDPDADGTAFAAARTALAGVPVPQPSLAETIQAMAAPLDAFRANRRGMVEVKEELDPLEHDLKQSEGRIRAAKEHHAEAEAAAKKKGTVDRFMAYCKAHGIKPDVTDYAVRSNKPEEAFADSYSLFLADPDFLNAARRASPRWPLAPRPRGPDPRRPAGLRAHSS